MEMMSKRCLGDCMDTYYPASKSNIQAGVFCEAWKDKQEGGDMPETRGLGYRKMCNDAELAYLSDNANDFFIAYGVNHANTQMSGYSSITTYNQATLEGLMGYGNTHLEGTVDYFVDSSKLTGVDPSFLWAYKYSRACPEDEEGISCYTVPTEP